MSLNTQELKGLEGALEKIVARKGVRVNFATGITSEAAHIERNAVDAVHELLSAHPHLIDTPHPVTGHTLLTASADANNVETARYLLNNGANRTATMGPHLIDGKPGIQFTPAHAALYPEGEYPEVLRILIDDADKGPAGFIAVDRLLHARSAGAAEVSVIGHHYAMSGLESKSATDGLLKHAENYVARASGRSIPHPDGPVSPAEGLVTTAIPGGGWIQRRLQESVPTGPGSKRR